MSKDFKIGDLVIINDIDQPCGRLVAVVVGLSVKSTSSMLLCEYLNADSDFDEWTKCQLKANVKFATHISDFGCVLLTDGSNYLVSQVGDSVARYPDGQLRRWQDAGKPTYRGRTHLFKYIADNIFHTVF